MRNQSWLPDGTLIKDEEIWQDADGFWFMNHITGEERPATDNEIAMLPDPDLERAKELLATSPTVISQPEMWELMRIFGRLHRIPD